MSEVIVGAVYEIIEDDVSFSYWLDWGNLVRVVGVTEDGIRYNYLSGLDGPGCCSKPIDFFIRTTRLAKEYISCKNFEQDLKDLINE